MLVFSYFVIIFMLFVQQFCNVIHELKQIGKKIQIFNFQVFGETNCKIAHFYILNYCILTKYVQSRKEGEPYILPLSLIMQQIIVKGS